MFETDDGVLDCNNEEMNYIATDQIVPEDPLVGTQFTSMIQQN